jgi:hypothetical protein
MGLQFRQSEANKPQNGGRPCKGRIEQPGVQTPGTRISHNHKPCKGDTDPVKPSQGLPIQRTISLGLHPPALLSDPFRILRTDPVGTQRPPVSESQAMGVLTGLACPDLLPYWDCHERRWFRISHLAGNRGLGAEQSSLVPQSTGNLGPRKGGSVSRQRYNRCHPIHLGRRDDRIRRGVLQPFRGVWTSGRGERVLGRHLIPGASQETARLHLFSLAAVFKPSIVYPRT